MAKDPVQEIRLLSQRSTEELQALRAQEVRNYQSADAGGLLRNVMRGVGAGLKGVGAAWAIGKVGQWTKIEFLQKPIVKQVIMAVTAGMAFFSSYREAIAHGREDAAARVGNIDTILQSRENQMMQQPTMQRLSQDDLAAYRQGQQAQGQVMGQFTGNAQRGPGQQGIGA